MAYVTNSDEYESIGTHWIALYVNDNNVTYFNSFGVEHIPKEIKKFIGNRNIITNIYRLQAYNSIMCGYFCIGFIDFMAGTSFVDTPIAITSCAIGLKICAITAANLFLNN